MHVICLPIEQSAAYTVKAAVRASRCSCHARLRDHFATRITGSSPAHASTVYRVAQKFALVK